MTQVTFGLGGLPGKWRQQDPPKCWYLSDTHQVTNHKTQGLLHCWYFSVGQ